MTPFGWKEINRSDTLGFVSLVLAFFFYAFVPSLLVRSICLLIGITIVFAVFLRSELTKTWPDSERLLAALVVSIITCVYACPQLWQEWQRRPKSPEITSIAANLVEPKPHLSAGLIVGSVGKRDGSLRILLENDGLVAITNLQSYVRSDIADAAYSLPNTAILDVRDKTEISVDTFASRRPLKVELYLTYESSSGPGYLAFFFIVPRVVVGSQPILPQISNEGKGQMEQTLAQQVLQDAFSTFVRNVGTIQLYFPAEENAANQSRLSFRSAHRLFVMDAVKHKVAIYGEYPAGRQLLESAIPPVPEIVAVTVTWNDDRQNLALYINGKAAKVEASPRKTEKGQRQRQKQIPTE